jgi:hypothetical protein
MAHYAFLNSKNIVTEVIVGRDETEVVDGISDWETYYGEKRGQRCVRTSYNGNIRKQYAGMGYTYDADADVFVAPQPYPSWTLDENHDWQPPVPMPESDGETSYYWSEDDIAWLEISAG